jgi:hypothetical protein
MLSPDDPKMTHVNEFAMASPISVKNRDMVFPSTLMSGKKRVGIISRDKVKGANHDSANPFFYWLGTTYSCKNFSSAILFQYKRALSVNKAIPTSQRFSIWAFVKDCHM